jgi:hypothetical protein
VRRIDRGLSAVSVGAPDQIQKAKELVLGA